MSQTQQFDGSSIEAALSAAAQHLGPNVQVAEARKVRKGGVLGFFAQERFEVDAFAQHGATAASRPRSMDEALEALVDDVERGDVPPATRNPTGTKSVYKNSGMVENEWMSSLNDFLASEREKALHIGEAPRGRHFAQPGEMPTAVAEAAQPVVQQIVAPEVNVTTLINGDADSRLRRARLAGGEPSWSTEALRKMGIPEPICELLDRMWPTTDVEWLACLEDAIKRCVPAPARSTDMLCTLGQGRLAAVAILQAGVAGIAPGIIYIEGAELVATPAELAMCVRACLPR